MTSNVTARSAGVLVLWDVDGTLLHAATYGGGVFERALEHVLGAPPPSRLRLSGKTDRQIAQEYLAHCGVDGHQHVTAILDRIALELESVRDSVAAEGAAYPGVEKLLAALDARDDVSQSLLTGNIPANAAVKVGAFGLDRYLDLETGAYGADHDDRCQLLAVAWHRQRALRGRDFVADRTWVIGDTPNDLRCARAGGAHCLLVATGSYSIEELQGLGADAVVADLTATDEIVALLTGTAD